MVWFVPDGNDIAGAHLDKHARLESSGSPKVVFVGGSNLMYGLDSARIEARVRMPVVNMGLNGYLGPRFLLNEVRNSLRKGDVVVLAFEYEAYLDPPPYGSMDGVGVDHLAVIKLRPESIFYLSSLKQYWQLFLAPAQISQAKVYRYIGIAKDHLIGAPVEVDPEAFLGANIEKRSGFNSYGDLVSHEGVTWAFPFWEDKDAGRKRPSEALATLVEEFEHEMAARQVKVLIAPPPAPRRWFLDNEALLEEAFDNVARTVGHGSGGSGGSGLGRPADYVWSEESFFDNQNHLNWAGRRQRTEVLEKLLGREVNGMYPPR